MRCEVVVGPQQRGITCIRSSFARPFFMKRDRRRPLLKRLALKIPLVLRRDVERAVKPVRRKGERKRGPCEETALVTRG